jgi:hypothetical protein
MGALLLDFISSYHINWFGFHVNVIHPVFFNFLFFFFFTLPLFNSMHRLLRFRKRHVSLYFSTLVFVGKKEKERKEANTQKSFSGCKQIHFCTEDCLPILVVFTTVDGCYSVSSSFLSFSFFFPCESILFYLVCLESNDSC